MEHTSSSLQETYHIADELVKTLRGGAVVLLEGELGAGKTAFTKGIARALGIADEVVSPTFGLMHVYPVSEHPTINELVHVDTYRLETEEELKEIGIEDYLGAPHVLTVIEWPEKLPQLLQAKICHRVRLQIDPQDRQKRIIVVVAPPYPNARQYSQ